MRLKFICGRIALHMCDERICIYIGWCTGFYILNKRGNYIIQGRIWHGDFFPVYVDFSFYDYYREYCFFRFLEK